MAERPGSQAIEDLIEHDMARLSLNAASESEQLPTGENDELQPNENDWLPPPENQWFPGPPLPVTRAPPEADRGQIRGGLSSSNSTAVTFWESLPIVRLEDLPENSQICHICKELFDDPEVEENSEFPLKLPCNHIMGSECLAKWFDENNSCPMCRATLFRQGVSRAELLRVLGISFQALSTLPMQLANEEPSEVLPTVQADLLSLSALRAENTEHLARLSEIQAAPETEESRAEVSQMIDRVMRNDVRLEEIEGRVQAMRR